MSSMPRIAIAAALALSTACGGIASSASTGGVARLEWHDARGETHEGAVVDVHLASS
jgi:hypothetical protein